MEKKHTLTSKFILVISIIGFSGGFLVPIFGIIDNIFWGGIISSWMDLVFFIIFALLCILGMILFVLTIKSSKAEDKFRRYAFILELIGLFINGFWIICGLFISK